MKLAGHQCADGAKPLGVLNAPELGQRVTGKAGQLRCTVTRGGALQNVPESIGQFLGLRRSAKGMSAKRKKGMFGQPVHERLPRGRVRGGFAFSRRGPSRFASWITC